MKIDYGKRFQNFKEITNDFHYFGVVGLEAEANQPQRRRVRLSQPDVRYCIYMMETYGEDYKVCSFVLRNFPVS